MNLYRFNQVIRYGWKDSNGNPLIFIDIIYCFFKYKLWSNQYISEDFYHLDKQARKELGAKYREAGAIRDAWQKRFQSDKKLYVKYGSAKYEAGNRRRIKRNKAYSKHYGAKEGLMVENDVQLCQQHYLNGHLSIGRNVLLAKHVFIDYSGEIIIGDNVQVLNGAIIESHYHPFHSDYLKSRNAIPVNLYIGEGAVICSRAVILPSCNYIGKNSRVGAGAVVTHDVPDYAVVAGCPARIIKNMSSLN